MHAAETSGPMVFWKIQVKQRFLNNLQLSYIFPAVFPLTLLQWMQIVVSTSQKCDVKEVLQMFFSKTLLSYFFLET